MTSTTAASRGLISAITTTAVMVWGVLLLWAPRADGLMIYSSGPRQAEELIESGRVVIIGTARSCREFGERDERPTRNRESSVFVSWSSDCSTDTSATMRISTRRALIGSAAGTAGLIVGVRTIQRAAQGLGIAERADAHAVRAAV